MNSEFIMFAMINYKVTEGATTLPIAQVKGLKNTCLVVYSTVLSTAISYGITNLESSKDNQPYSPKGRKHDRLISWRVCVENLRSQDR